ncbi:MAG: UPF0182 family protein [Anaerolineales bacterium]|nr:UPF0182 family protein [Anaerolineales bacterium]
MSLGNRLRLWTLIIIGFIVYLIVQFGVGFYTDYLWFQQLKLESVLLTGLWARVWAGLVVALPVVILFWINIFIARWQSIRNVLFFSDETLLAQRFIVWIIWLAGLILGWLVAVAAASDWLLLLRFVNGQDFNLADPIFNRDVGFYIFSLPVYHFAQRWLIIALFLSLFGAAAIYAMAQQNNLAEGRVVVLPHVQLHLSVIGVFIFLTFAAGHWLDLFDLMYSTRGVAFGASYTDINVSMPALWVMVAVAVIAAVMLLVNIFLRRPALSLLAIFIWIVAGIVGGGFIPGLVQRYAVEPNELAREAPYIENNIRFTNLAYGLDKIQERDFTQVEPLTREALTVNETTLKNIRLWDYRPLQQTYQQIQAIRLYYRFLDIDLDRYTINGEIRQVALAARELDIDQLQEPTWVTQRLQFTHGYGVVVNPVNEVTGDGLPQLWVKDLPPESSVGLQIDRPEIYHGEGTEDYVFVQTKEREFNYPSGEQNVYTNYEGTGGVVLDSYLKRLAFALRLADINMLLSQDFTPSSRVMLHRNITDRARRIAPFLRYDRDPYLVIGTDGRLYWLLDAYTTSDRFPYSEPMGDLNYIRNSVKVVVDAYDGMPIFYVVDPADPLVKSYTAIFPSLFTPISAMPDWLRAHLRYPEDLFSIQARLYQTYHMRDVNVFYNKEDLWQTPMETFAGNTQPVEPYYVVLRLPGETQNEYVLTQPFTPNNKDNLIAWLAARSDGENYGQLVAYRFPKQELVYGPLQIEARIDQDPEISAQITLWSQSGSQVIRGNLLVLPIDNSLLYVEPLYLQALNGQIPELRRVIVVAGDQVVMRETLAAGLQALFGETGPALTSTEPPPTAETEPAEPATPTVSSSQDINQLAVTASTHYEAAQKALQNGDWATYGEELEKMKAALDALVRLTSQE